ncbi:MAG: PBSX family phage terminase large subunit [Salinivirgaceae bacterium]|nr:PBSX family phage terminase large subunit [Salinivirgaceae bacterium]
MQYNTCNSKFFETFTRPERIKCYYGGSGSGKSLSIAQHFIMQLCSGDGKRRAILRKTFPRMKATTYLIIKDILDDWEIPYEENKTDHVFRLGKNELYYLSLDDSEKIKGAEFIDVWMEEATEFTEDDYKQLRIRLSRTSENAVIYMSFNPIDKDHWAIRDVVDRAPTDKRILVHHSTYKDNIKFLSEAFIEELESFIDLDENFYRVYALGLPGVLKGQIYSGWKFEDPDEWPSGVRSGTHLYGLDFGFNAPMAMVEIWIYDEEYYIRELVYERGLTTNDLLGRMEELRIDKKADLFCDSAEPDRIEELRKSGYNAKSSKKDVKAGIDYVKGCTIHIDAVNSPNIYTEVNNYKWKETKDGKALDEPVKAFDHSLDAIRYSIFSWSPTVVRSVPRFGGSVGVVGGTRI